MSAAEAEPGAPLSDCWNRIGVRGDGSCPELAVHAHCRNCPVTANAGARLLDRPPAPGERRAWAAASAVVRSEKAATDAAAFVFRLGAEWLALPAGWVQEAAAPRAIHAIPHRRGGTLAGLVNLNGELIPCVALGRLLGVEAAAPGTAPAARRLLLAGRGVARLAFEADEVHGVLRYIAAEARPAPSRPAHVRALLRHGEHPVGLLDPDTLWPALERGIA